MSHRIFLAIPIPEDLQHEILVWKQRFLNLSVRWLSGKNLHITLVPPWQESNPQRVVDALTTLTHPLSSPTISLAKISFGPDPKLPRLIWASGETPNEFTALKQSLETALHLPKGNRNPKIHITLARFRPDQFTRFPIKTLNETIDWQLSANSFVLMESHLSSTGADYEILSEFPFL